MSASIEELSIAMPLQMARFVRKKVSAGLFNDPSEVVRDALRRVMEQEARGEPPPLLTPSELSKAKRGLENGIKDLEEGRYTEFTEEGLREFFAGVTARGRNRLAP